MMERLKTILTNALLSFALISIGFALGKHSVQQNRLTAIAPVASLPDDSGPQVAVYYLHSTFRCVTCNTIEEMTRSLLDQNYSDQLADGSILWIEDDFQENETLAKQFDVAASCVVVADLRNGKVVDYQRLDEVWTFMKVPEAFNLYIGDAIDVYLKRNGESQ
jgi:hypothetical protein